MDKLQQYLQHHAEELDVDVPTPEVWQQIQQRMASPQKPLARIRRLPQVLRYAAAACVLGFAVVGAWHVWQTAQPSALAVNHHLVPGKAAPKPTATIAEKTQTHPTPTPQLTETALAGVKKMAATPRKQPAASHAVTVLQSINQSFTQVINLQRARVNTMPLLAENPSYFADFKVAFAQMDNDEKVIKKEIAQAGTLTNDLLDRLITVYQQKLAMLKQLQNEINKTNSRYKQGRPTAENATTYFLNI